MPFELPDNLHPNCGPVAWLLGTWRGNGHGAYPTIEPFHFGQELIFTHDGRPFFHYMARAWIVDEQGEFVRDAAMETGFLRCPEPGKVEFLLSRNIGFSEIWYGAAEGGKVDGPLTVPGMKEPVQFLPESQIILLGAPTVFTPENVDQFDF